VKDARENGAAALDAVICDSGHCPFLSVPGGSRGDCGESVGDWAEQLKVCGLLHKIWACIGQSKLFRAKPLVFKWMSWCSDAINTCLGGLG
jgi:hypothetical protein